MATPVQYACFKDIYEREIARHVRLIDRGKLYLSVITLYLGLLSVAADSVVPLVTHHPLTTAAYLASFVAFVAALCLVVYAIGIYTYVYPTDPESTLLYYDRHNDGRLPADAEFLDRMVVEFATAFTANHPVNERRATLLKYASFAMLAGIAAQAVVLSSFVFV